MCAQQVGVRYIPQMLLLEGCSKALNSREAKAGAVCHSGEMTCLKVYYHHAVIHDIVDLSVDLSNSTHM